MIVLLDIGSTLIEGPSAGPGKRLAAALGIQDAAAVNRLLFQTPLDSASQAASELCARFGLDSDIAVEQCENLWQAQQAESYVLPGAVEAIARLREAGIPRAYISNIWPPFFSRFLEAFPEEQGMPQFLSFRTGMMKPSIEFYRCALDALQVSPREVVMVGDTYFNDIAPALALGMRTIWVLHRPEKEKCALTGVLNGALPPPHRTLCSIQQLTPDLLYESSSL